MMGVCIRVLVAVVVVEVEVVACRGLRANMWIWGERAGGWVGGWGWQRGVGALPPGRPHALHAAPWRR